MAGVDPFGKIYKTVARDGTLMGNRGKLTKHGAIVRNWQGRRWIYCVCEGPRIEVSYTKLFFRDEATALSPGNFPPFPCQKSLPLALTPHRGVPIFSGRRNTHDQTGENDRQDPGSARLGTG